VEDAGTRSAVWFNEVDIDLFTVFDVPILAGRGFVQSDAARGANAVVVDRVFAEQVLGGGDVIGRRVRRVVRREDGTGEVEAGPWLEIVGVVPAFTPPPPFETVAQKLYQPLALAVAQGPLHLGIRVRGGAAPAAFVARLLAATNAVAPSPRPPPPRSPPPPRHPGAPRRRAAGIRPPTPRGHARRPPRAPARRSANRIAGGARAPRRPSRPGSSDCGGDRERAAALGGR